MSNGQIPQAFLTERWPSGIWSFQEPFFPSTSCIPGLMAFAMRNILYLHQGNEAGRLGRLSEEIDPDTSWFFGQGAVLSPVVPPDILSPFIF